MEVAATCFKSFVEQMGELVVFYPPSGIEQQVGGGLGDKSLNCNIRSQSADYHGTQCHIFIKGEAGYIVEAGFHVASHSGASDELKLMKFYSIDRQLIYPVDCGHDRSLIFAGESDDEVESAEETAGVCKPDRADCVAPCVAAVDS